MRIFSILLLSSALLFSCNKEKRYSSKLQKGERWSVTEISVDGTSLGVDGTWSVTSDTDIYDAVPLCTWTNTTGDAVFEWQFQNKGKTFVVNYFQLLEENEGFELDDLDYVAYDLSGSYKVDDHKNKKMTFESSSTIGYSGKNVRISIERK